MANHTDRNPADRPFTAVAFLREQLQPVRSLAGFRKDTHRVPDSATGSNEKFVAQLAQADLDRDMDQRFAALKSAFGFKRVEMDVSGPAEGAGTIITPFFTYHVQVNLHAANPAEALWQRRVADVHQPAQALTDAFAEVFDKTFDTIEFTPAVPVDITTLIDRIEDLDDDRIQVEYDRAATNCTLTMTGVKGEIRVAGESVRFYQRAVADPRQLVQSLGAIQKALAEMHDILPLVFV